MFIGESKHFFLMCYDENIFYYMCCFPFNSINSSLFLFLNSDQMEKAWLVIWSQSDF